MTAETVFAAAMAAIAEGIGHPATYTPAGGQAVTLRVNLEVEVEPQPDGYGGGAWTQITTIEGLISGFGREPDIGDTVAIGAVTYTVKRVLENDGLWVKVAVK
jgi:hypothetical protein